MCLFEIRCNTTFQDSFRVALGFDASLSFSFCIDKSFLASERKTFPGHVKISTNRFRVLNTSVFLQVFDILQAVFF